jgi:hypothetical protein
LCFKVDLTDEDKLEGDEDEASLEYEYQDEPEVLYLQFFFI